MKNFYLSQTLNLSIYDFNTSLIGPWYWNKEIQALSVYTNITQPKLRIYLYSPIDMVYNITLYIIEGWQGGLNISLDSRYFLSFIYKEKSSLNKIFMKNLNLTKGFHILEISVFRDYNNSYYNAKIVGLNISPNPLFFYLVSDK